MARNARTRANRANGALSTGPRTEEGKSISRSNALRHGMTSKQLVLPHENQEEWETLREGIVTAWAPATDLEHTMAVSIAETYWRLLRLRRIETAVLAARMKAVIEAGPSLEGDDALAALMTDPEEMKRMNLMLRYITSAERAHNKATADLRKLQQARRDAEVAELEEFENLEVTVRPSAGKERVGFVSQKALEAEFSPEVRAEAERIMAMARECLGRS